MSIIMAAGSRYIPEPRELSLVGCRQEARRGRFDLVRHDSV